MMKYFLQAILTILMRLVLWRCKPTIIAVTGSVGKTTTKEAIGHVLQQHFGREHVIVAEGNYNTEIGVPLVVLGARHPGRFIPGWIVVVLRALWRMIRGGGARIYVLEFGADRPGDIAYLARTVRPTIGVVTAVGEIPVHVEYYETPQEVVAEKGRLIEALFSHGVAVLNVDEEHVWEMRRRTRATVVGVGVSKEAGVRASDVLFYPEHLFNAREPSVALKVNTKSTSVPLRLHHAVTRGQIFAALMAIAVGRAVGVPLLECVEALHDWQPPEGRLRPMQGTRSTVLLDDSYNASPLSMQLALETLGQFDRHRRIAVLGDMRELGRYSEEAHEQAGRHAARHADVLVAVGRYGPIIASAAEEAGMSRDAVHSVLTAGEATDLLFSLIEEEDVLLIKGSRAVGMEEIVRALSSAEDIIDK